MPCRLPGDERVRWRCLDSLGWALVALAGTLYVPPVGRTVLGELSLAYMAPLVWAACSALALGEPGGLSNPWQVWRLRAAWLTACGLGPFFGWWLRCADVPYFAAAAVAAVAAFSWALLETSFLVSQAARSRALPGLALDALAARVGVFYLLVVPALALWVTFLAALLKGWASAPGDWLRLWRQMPGWGRALLVYGPMGALLNLARLMLRASGCMQRLLRQGAALPQGETGPERKSEPEGRPQPEGEAAPQGKHHGCTDSL